MSRSIRMFEIIQLLRAAPGPMTSDQIADALEVSPRTVYRDIAALQAMRTPIEGAAGLGYVLRSGYDLPPVNFDAEEAEAVRLGLSMIARTGDSALLNAARRAARKLDEAAPNPSQLIASACGIPPEQGADLAVIRGALREAQVLALNYGDVAGKITRREVWPLALIYYSDVALLAAWCTLREDYRHFRIDRVQEAIPLEQHFISQAPNLRAEWEALHKADTVTTAA